MNRWEAMSHTCSKCSRINPDDAVYCYYDGFALNGHAGGRGPVSVGSQAFGNPFIFPSGRTCRSFDELAIACQEEWDAARDLLQQGFLGAFFGGLGRADLALAAEEAKRFPDHDRGLDQLLAKLPTDVLNEPQLHVEPEALNLGTVKAGEDRELMLHLDNQGMRLLYGTVTCEDTPWLVLGDKPGVPKKIFQFGHEMGIPVHVVGKHLRASNKPLEGKLVIESNGGDFLVGVRAEVPVKPYPGSGVLAGAKSPRQVAEKAKANPKEAALLFEKGEVAEWYKSNGWTYPVQGPAASGLGAVQQFFEALGLTPAPKVTISDRSVTLQASAGDNNLRHTLEIKTDEKKPVYAHGSSNVPWLEVSRAKLNGRVATITLTIPTVPNKPGETLTGKVTVQSNGNQRFVVPVTLQIGGNFNFTDDVPEPMPILEPEPIVSAAPAPLAAVETYVPPPVRVRRQQPPSWGHAVPAALLALALLILVIVDVTGSGKGDRGGKSKGPKDGVGGAQSIKDLEKIIKDEKVALSVKFSDDQRFGLSISGQHDPKNRRDNKKLTFEYNGFTNNTIVKIDDSDFYFGRSGGQNRWLKKNEEVVPDRYWRSTMRMGGIKNVVVTQNVMLVPGSSKQLDTALIFYTIKNEDTSDHFVALRMMLDTYIGANDGVPFTVSGEKGFLTTLRVFPDKKLPDYIEAVENPNEDPAKRGTVARLGLKDIRLPGITIDEPVKLVVCRYPQNPQQGWDWQYAPMNAGDKPDSCVVLYWGEERVLKKGGTRHVGFTYGLSTLGQLPGSGTPAGGNLLLSVPDNVYENKEFVVTAYVYNAREGEKVTLELPDGLSLADGESAEKAVSETARRTTVFWKVKAGKKGSYDIKATSPKSKTSTEVVVKGKSLFG